MMFIETPVRETTMKAIVHRRFGLLELEEIERPVPGDDDVLVRVRAASLNAGDWYAMAGRPYVGRVAMGLRKPKGEEFGADLAGVVEAVGRNVTRLQPGDEVFGARGGACAEYVCVPQDRGLVPK